jgi:hypothetical protein
MSTEEGIRRAANSAAQLQDAHGPQERATCLSY